MKTRTCPYCDYQYSRKNYFKKLSFKLIWSKWDCPNCSKKITFNFNRHLLVVLGYMVWMFILLTIKSLITMNIYWGIGLILFFIIGGLFIFSFDTFKEAK